MRKREKADLEQDLIVTWSAHEGASSYGGVRRRSVAWKDGEGRRDDSPNSARRVMIDGAGVTRRDSTRRNVARRSPSGAPLGNPLEPFDSARPPCASFERHDVDEPGPSRASASRPLSGEREA